MPENRWNDLEAPAQEGLGALTYRSRLLGSDRSVVNIYGGNTSVKSLERDHLGREVSVLWVKGSGSDIASIDERGFAGLKLEEVLPLRERGAMSDEEMVAYLERCAFEPGRPRQSIETLLHAFVPAPHVDHNHPDAIISLACSPKGRQIVREIYGDRAAWVDYIRPGFTLSKQIGAAVLGHPEVECVVMAKHGLVTWGATSKECYANTLRIIAEAEDYLARHPLPAAIPSREGPELPAELLLALRGAMAALQPTVLCADQSPEVLRFLARPEVRELSQVGAACPDHLVHTKRVPLFLDWEPGQGQAALLAEARKGVQRFAEQYRAYFAAHAGPGDQIFPPTPRIVLIPGLGMVASGPDAWGAEVSRQLYRRAISVMSGALSCGGFSSLSPAESFAVEYWPLELYKLSLRPRPRPLAGKVAVVTGGASGIGRATALRLAEEGAHVAVLDLNGEGAAEVAAAIERRSGYQRAMAVQMDVTDEAAVQSGFERVVRRYGGVDLVVSNAGISSSAPIEDTSLELWNRNLSVLATGYFLVARAAFRTWKAQGCGGNLVFVGSKNSVAAGRNAGAYSAAKAAELHLARCLAEEGGPLGIRVNSVLPDAVLSGSSIWSSSWRQERAATYGIEEGQLEEFYRARTTLKVSVFPEDVAEAIYFLASPASAKTTGGVITVDGGVPAAYVR